MEWDNDKCLKLIALYELKPELWQARHKFFHNKNKKYDAWNEIATDMGTTTDMVKSKLNSLLSSFRREKTKQEGSVGTGKGRDEIYRSKWFGFEAFQFLMVKNKCRKSLNTHDGNKKQTVEDENFITNEDENQQTTEYETLDNTHDNIVPKTLENCAQNIASNDTVQETTIQQASVTVPKTKNRKSEVTSDPRIEKAFNILQSCAERDTCDIYGQLVATKLKSYTKRTQNVVQHLVNNILFNADMGQYEGNTPYSHASSSYASTVPSPYPSPESNVSSQPGSNFRVSTPYSQPPSPSPTYHATQPYNEPQIKNASLVLQPPTAVNTSINTQISSSLAADFITNFKPSSDYLSF